MSIQLVNKDNMDYVFYGNKAKVIYCDYIYENLKFSSANKFWEYLDTDGVFIAQTDWHSNHRYRVHMENVLEAYFVNELVWKNEWGNFPKNKFHQCYDNIIIYSKNRSYKFYPDRIQIPKVTMTKGLNPSGRTTKPATAWIDDIALTTTAKERVKKEDGHLAKWQKPLKLYSRIILPFCDEGDFVLDPFMGVGTLAKWCSDNNRDYLGIEKDKEVFELAKKNLYGE
jgi:DNA modification methylase